VVFTGHNRTTNTLAVVNGPVIGLPAPGTLVALVEHALSRSTAVRGPVP
jgi:hypothetical protein